jgi:hypothetical protein
MGALSIRLMPEPVRSLAFGSISGTYAGVGSALSNPARIVLFQNFTDQTVMLSFDGIEDHFPIASNGFVLLDITANKTVTQGFYIGEGTRFYVRDIGSAATSGDVYISVFYGIDM